MEKSSLIELPIINEPVLLHLKSIEKEVKFFNKELNQYYLIGKDNNFSLEGCSDEYFNHILKLPEKYQQAKSFKMIMLKNYKQIDSKIVELKNYLPETYTGLGVLYNKEDYLGWHHNSTNSNLYDILFTFNETGNGYFKYFDTLTKKIIKIKDKQGWSFKAGCFPKNLDKAMWHCAYSNSLRITVARVTFEEKKFKEYIKLISGVTV